jgi:hypothetical protein
MPVNEINVYIFSTTSTKMKQQACNAAQRNRGNNQDQVYTDYLS